MMPLVHVVPGAVPPSLCDNFLFGLREDGWADAVIVNAEGGVQVDTAIRRSSVTWLEEGHWLELLLRATLERANATAFRFVIDSYERVQVTRYQPGEYYHWHYDMLDAASGADVRASTDGSCRKLSLVLQLSSSTSYAGGDVLIQEGYGPVRLAGSGGAEYRNQGTVLIFPATVQHCVAPVVAGTRYSAVLWASGPFWR